MDGSGGFFLKGCQRGAIAFRAEQTVGLVKKNPNPLFRKADAESAFFWSAESAVLLCGKHDRGYGVENAEGQLLPSDSGIRAGFPDRIQLIPVDTGTFPARKARLL